jgi:hypothetical protein
MLGHCAGMPSGYRRGRWCPQRPYGNEANDKTHKRFLEEVGEPASCLFSMVCVLQLLLHSQNFKGNACYGKRDHGSRLGIGRIADLTRLQLIIHNSGRLFLSEC